MDEGREPIERLLSSVAIETNKENHLMLNHNHKRLISRCLTVLVAGWQGLCHRVGDNWMCAETKAAPTQTDYTNLSSWEMTRPWAPTHTLVRTTSPFPQPCPLISYRPTVSQHPPRAPGFHCVTLSQTVCIGSISRGATGQTLAVPPHSGNQRDANKTKMRVHSSDYAKLNFFKQK